MKKLFIAAGLVAMMALGSCSGNKSNEAAASEATDFKAKIENCTNQDSIAVYVDQAKAYAEQLVKEGKVAEARKYLDDITPVVEQKAPALVSVINTAKEGLDKLPEAATEGLTDAASDAVDAAKDKAEDAKDAVSEKAEAAKEKAEAVKDAAKDKAESAVNSAKDAAAGARNAAVNQATNAINNAIGK